MHTPHNDVSLVVIKAPICTRMTLERNGWGLANTCSSRGHKHWSGGDKKEGATFYQEGSGKFDLIPVK